MSLANLCPLLPTLVPYVISDGYLLAETDVETIVVRGLGSRCTVSRHTLVLISTINKVYNYRPGLSVCYRLNIWWKDYRAIVVLRPSKFSRFLLLVNLSKVTEIQTAHVFLQVLEIMLQLN